MPAFIKSERDEKKWAAAKLAVKKSRNKSESTFTDQDWGLVNTIYQTSSNPAHRFKRLREKLKR